MYRVIWDNNAVHLTYSNDLVFKVLDTKDLVCELLTGKQLLEAGRLLGEKQFSGIYFNIDEVHELRDYYTRHPFGSFIYNSNPFVKLKNCENGFRISIKPCKKHIDFTWGESGSTFFINGQQFFIESWNEEDGEYDVGFLSMYIVGNNILKVTLDLAFSGDQKAFIYLYIDINTGDIFRVRYEYILEHMVCDLILNDCIDSEYMGIKYVFECKDSAKNKYLDSLIAKSKLLDVNLVE